MRMALLVIGIVALALSAVLLLMALRLFVREDIPGTWADLTGRRRQRDLADAYESAHAVGVPEDPVTGDDAIMTRVDPALVGDAVTMLAERGELG